MSAEVGFSRRRCAVIGSPVVHSLSPALHRAAYRSLGLPWDYGAHDVSVDQLPGFVGSLSPQWRGLSVTMPLKQSVVALCDWLEPMAVDVAAVNTVVFEADGTRRGYNTDITGFGRALRGHGLATVESAVVVGAGATAASALAALRHLGADSVTVLGRSAERASALKEVGRRLDIAVRVCTFESLGSVPPAGVVISTIPANAQQLYADRLASLAPVVFDVIYAPWQPPLLRAAEAAGREIIRGFELLLHQAGRQVELMTGVAAAPLDDMRAAGLAAVRQL
jgi:shikimate dehydrogenase